MMDCSTPGGAAGDTAAAAAIAPVALAGAAQPAAADWSASEAAAGSAAAATAAPPPSHSRYGSHSSSGNGTEMRHRIGSALSDLQEAQQQRACGESDSAVPCSVLPLAAASTPSLPPVSSPTMRDTDDAVVSTHTTDGSHSSVSSAAGAVAPIGISDRPSSSPAKGGDSVPFGLLSQCRSDGSEDERASMATGRTAEGSLTADVVVPLFASSSDAPPELDANGLTPLQRRALEQASQKKEKGVSCHQCKTSKDGSVLLFCVNKAEKGRRKRNCMKKYVSVFVNAIAVFADASARCRTDALCLRLSDVCVILSVMRVCDERTI